jgi:GcrA cell cycle regulator
MRNAVTARTWSEVRVQALKALAAEGLTANQIAEAIGSVSRNAVVGKAHRLGLVIGGGGPSEPTRRATTPPRAARTRRAAAPKPPSPPRPPSRPQGARAARPAQPVEAIGPVVALTALTARTCHWPLGDPGAADFGFCGAPVRRAPYCALHRARAYRPVPAARLGRDEPSARRAA